MDFRVEREGNQFMVTPLTEAAMKWVQEHVEVEGWQWFGQSFCVDQHYVDDLVLGMVDAGLDVEENVR